MASTSGDEERPTWPHQVRENVTVGRVVMLGVTGFSLYAVFPGLAEVWSSWPDVVNLRPAYLVLVVVMQVVSFIALWALLRICLRTDGWFGVATSQLASNAFSRVVPGGAAAGGALQYRMLTRAGARPAIIATGLTVSALLTTATLLALPVLTLPVARRGNSVDASLVTIAWIGGGVLIVGVAAGFAVIRFDGPLRVIGRGFQWVRNLVLRRREPASDIPDRLLAERDLILGHLQSSWVRAVVFALSKWGFEFATLFVALQAVGESPDPFVILLTFAASGVLGMIPLTPGGLGFVEAGLTAMLVLAGVSAGNAALAVLLFRLVSFWLPIPAGAVAYGLFQRRYRDRAPA